MFEVQLVIDLYNGGACVDVMKILITRNGGSILTIERAGIDFEIYEEDLEKMVVGIKTAKKFLGENN